MRATLLAGRRSQTIALALAAALAMAASPSAVPNAQLTITVDPLSSTNPSGADFAAGQVTALVHWTIVCGSKTPCVGTVIKTAAMTAPSGSTTTFEYSLNGGTTWFVVPGPGTTGSGAQFGSVPTANTTLSGTFLLRYHIGWTNSPGPFTPAGAYSMPVRFDLQQS